MFGAGCGRFCGVHCSASWALTSEFSSIALPRSGLFFLLGKWELETSALSVQVVHRSVASTLN